MFQSKAKWKFINAEGNLHQSESASVIEKLYIQKGLQNTDERERFLNPSIDYIMQPQYLAQIDIAKQRIIEAIKQNEKIVVYGDYDADGVTATTVMVEGLRRMGADCTYYIPNRFTEGYGLHESAIKSFYAEEISLMITVDTGIANIDEIEVANSLGIDVIITDHHEVQENLPNAFAIIHPLLSPNYSFKALAGVGIAWQFVCFLLENRQTDLLDLVAIGTIADLVPLIDENRMLVHAGLKQINETERIGLSKLIQACRLENSINEKDIGFSIAPRINAVGRLEDATLVVELLLTDDESEAEYIVTKIDSINIERQKIVQEIVRDAEELVNEEDVFIILANDYWSEGVLGIAASRLVSTYHRPVMLLTKDKHQREWKGSARSIPSFNLFENGMKIRELFSNFGGHSQAAGMSFMPDHFTEIKEFLNNQVKKVVGETILKPEMFIHQKIKLEEINEQLVNDIRQFAPFGMENTEPLFLLEAIPTQIRQLGQHKNHLKMQFQSEHGIIDAIGFQFGELAHLIAPQSTVLLVGSLEINEWNGRRTVQILIKDIAVKEWQLFDYRGKPQFSNIDTYLRNYQENTLLCHNPNEVAEYDAWENLRIITYGDSGKDLPKTDLLFIYDLPTDINELAQIIKKTMPQSVHVSYQVAQDAFLQSIPNREEFKWVYGYLKKFQPVYLKIDIPKMMQMKKLTKERIIFILKVFHDLKFIEVNEGITTVNSNVTKVNLETSKTYQRQINQGEIERILYYSSYYELKDWILQYVAGTQEEETIYGAEGTY